MRFERVSIVYNVYSVCKLSVLHSFFDLKLVSFYLLKDVYSETDFGLH